MGNVCTNILIVSRNLARTQIFLVFVFLKNTIHYGLWTVKLSNIIDFQLTGDALYGDDVVMLAPTVSLAGKNLNFFRCFFQVWVGGTKPGRIDFLGETKFAPGEWAGVVLDEPVGKNDGSVGGVSYFKASILGTVG